MSAEKTLITEVVTGLGMLPSFSLDHLASMSSMPKELDGLAPEDWSQLVELWRGGGFVREFEQSFENGRYFFGANDGLRGRAPVRVEWKGPHHPPDHNPVPADLRVDGVYLVSNKALSKVLRNPSPTALFRGGLVEGSVRGSNWYLESAPNEFQDLYRESLNSLNLPMEFPESVADLTREQQRILKSEFREGWPEEVRSVVERFIEAVGTYSANCMKEHLRSRKDKEEMYWRFLRILGTQYYVLGLDRRGPIRLRVPSAWDFQRTFDLVDFIVDAQLRGQPQISWRANLRRKQDGEDLITEGHVEIRWSHGKFVGVPESKIYLDTPFSLAAGYEELR